MRAGPLVVLGDSLLDRDIVGRSDRLCPDVPVPVVDEVEQRRRPGGAALAALLAAQEREREVVLVTGLGTDDSGGTVADLLTQAGVRTVDVGLDGATPQKIRVLARGTCVVRLDRHCADVAPVGPLTDEARDVLSSAVAVLVSDYGRGMSAAPSVRVALERLDRRTPVVWDPHPRGAPPVAGCRLVTPNRSEAAGFSQIGGGDHLAAQTARARDLRDRWRAAAVTVTMGRDGALLVESDGPPFVAPAPAVASGDACGAGDRFASAAALLLAGGAVVSEAVLGAVEIASSFVAGGGVLRLGTSSPAATDAAGQPSDAEALVARIRAQGGTVVATGGCFDVLHAGHVSLLRAARRMGDCLMVCLNSDESVRRLKGAHRPRSTQDDRAAVLLALECVDAVACFDEDTPTAILDRLRPDIFVKGGDYAGTNLPEAPLLESWGGQAVVLPYLAGRSTTRLLEELEEVANR